MELALIAVEAALIGGLAYLGDRMPRVSAAGWILVFLIAAVGGALVL
jgi:hypothetical protein